MRAEAKPRLLIVEDDQGLQAQLKWAYDDFEVVIAGDRASAIAALRAEEPAVVTLDLGLPPDPDGTSEGFAVLDQIVALKPDTKVIVASGHGARESALTAIERGAYDFYPRRRHEQLGLIVRRAVNLHRIETETARWPSARGEANRVLAGSSPERRNGPGGAYDRTGGKRRRLGDAARRERHRQRAARARPARGQPAQERRLRRDQLRGDPRESARERAVRPREGRLHRRRQDHRGQDRACQRRHAVPRRSRRHPLPLQVKLLRFLQERQIERIGGRKTIDVDTRIVCATHQDLEAMISDGRFREDLFYRLAEVVVKIPPLAERPGDAALLARAFLKRFAREMNPQVTGFASDALTAIDAWGWPGNVRELENRVKRAAIMADGKLVTAADLDLQQGADADSDVLNLKSARERADRKVIRHALARSEGNISNTARLLGISRPTLYDLLKTYDLQG